MPSSYELSTLIALVQKCTTATPLKKARQLHALILTATNSDHQSPYVNNNVLSMYAKCGCLVDTRLVFDGMPRRNIVSYNALVAAYSRAPDYAFLSFQVLERMGTEGIRPNGPTFTSLTQACSDRLTGCAIHGQIVKFGFLTDVRVQTSLLGMYSNCGDSAVANEVFFHMFEKDSTAWNSMIFWNLRKGKIEEALWLYAGMLKAAGSTPTHFTYSMLLNACSKMCYYRLGQLFHLQTIVAGLPVDLPLQNALLDMYCSCGDTQTAFTIFSRSGNLDLVSWNSMIAGLSENEDREEAIGLFVQLQKTSSHKPDEFSFAAVISAAGAFPARSYGRPLHAQIIRAGFVNSVYIGSTLVSMYFRNCEPGSAEDAFTSVSEKDAVLWTEMITGHSKVANVGGAVKYFTGMCRDGHQVDNFPLSACLGACADAATLRLGETIHSQALKTGFDAEISVCGSLVDMYAKNGDLQYAKSMFYQIVNPDLKCWNSMLGAYSHHGRVEEALKLYDDFLRHGYEPDQVTYIILLSACGHCGLVGYGKQIWSCMKKRGVEPGVKHYSCMVNLLGRAGLLGDAEKLIRESPFGRDNPELWRTLLSSCIVKKNLDIGVHAAEQILRLDSKDSAAHVLLSNLYAVAGRWEDVAKVRKRVRGLVMEKDPGLSWIEFGNDIHVFSSGEQSHPKAGESQAEVQSLQRNMIRNDQLS